MTTKARVSTLIIDCHGDDLVVATRFWTAALGRNATEGDPATAKYVSLEKVPGQVDLHLQKVDHESRIHLDIDTEDVEPEVARLEALGARRIETVKSWVVMEAPTGHRFCVVKVAKPA
jgi:hypothetical protein